MKNQIDCTGIAVLLYSIGVIIGGVHFWPVELTLACDTWLVFINLFTAFFLSGIHYFAIDTELTVSGSVGFGLIGLVVVLTVVAVVVGPVVLTPWTIVAPVEI
jgi:hypothetical protein